MDQRSKQTAQEAISSYIHDCRKRVEVFSEGHFTFKATWEIQKETFWRDLAIAPINSVWSVPYLMAKKVLEILEKLGVHWAAKVSPHLPTGLRSGYQKQMEFDICQHILGWNLYKRPRQFPEPLEIVLPSSHSKAIRRLIDQYFSTRALVSDLASTFTTLVVGRVVFGDTSLGIQSMAYLLAKKKAHHEAASGFFLGSGVGNAFYQLFPPTVQESDVRIFLVSLVLLLALTGMISTMVSDPIRKKLGLHERRLNLLLDDIDKELLYLSHKNAYPPKSTR